MTTESDRAENEFSHGGPQSDRKAKRWCANLIDRLCAADDVFSDLNGKKIYPDDSTITPLWMMMSPEWRMIRTINHQKHA